MPRSGRSPGGGNGCPLQDSCLENPMDRGAWQATVQGGAKCWTWLKWLSTHAHVLLNQMKWSEMNSLSCIWLFATPWTVAYRAPPSMAFSRQEYWSGLPFPSPGDLPDPGIKPRSPELQADALPSEPPGKPSAPNTRLLGKQSPGVGCGVKWTYVWISALPITSYVTLDKPGLSHLWDGGVLGSPDRPERRLRCTCFVICGNSSLFLDLVRAPVCHQDWEPCESCAGKCFKFIIKFTDKKKRC